MWIKICGVTRPVDAIVVARSGADAIGLNFFAGSRRCVSAQTARQIVAALGRRAETVPSRESPAGVPEPAFDSGGGHPEIVGVFVNSAPAHVSQIVDDAGLTAVQFHGDETADQIAEFHELQPGIPIIRAIRLRREDSTASLRSLERLLAAVPLAACLLDAHVAGEYGGTGRTVDPDLVRCCQASFTGLRLILAGGLTPENVGMAIAELRPWGIDTASGVEIQPGIKDADRVTAFVDAAARFRQAGSIGTNQDRRRLRD